MAPPYKRIHVVINPASGKGEPVLKYLADVCREHDVDWDISITRKYGDATQQASDALARGVDLVVGCGGDGTQHEIANAVMGSGKPMGILPGGTGNGFATEMGIPKDFRKAVEVLCTSDKRAPRRRDARRRPVLHPAAVRGHRAGAAGEPRAEEPSTARWPTR